MITLSTRVSGGPGPAQLEAIQAADRLERRRDDERRYAARQNICRVDRADFWLTRHTQILLSVAGAGASAR